jgi:hypothetical protein
LLFKALEDYYRFKLNIHPSEKFWNWELRKNDKNPEDFVFDFNDFLVFFENQIKNK